MLNFCLGKTASMAAENSDRLSMQAIIFVVVEFIIQFCIEAIFHEFGNGFLEQILDVIHAADIAALIF